MTPKADIGDTIESIFQSNNDSNKIPESDYRLDRSSPQSIAIETLLKMAQPHYKDSVDAKYIRGIIIGSMLALTERGVMESSDALNPHYIHYVRLKRGLGDERKIYIGVDEFDRAYYSVLGVYIEEFGPQVRIIHWGSDRYFLQMTRKAHPAENLGQEDSRQNHQVNLPPEKKSE
jgi:hypothetical protein